MFLLYDILEEFDILLKQFPLNIDFLPVGKYT
jgi:hypothetical protein